MTQLLIIEDHEKLRLNLQYLLRKDGYVVDIAESGEEGFYLANTKKYDLIVLDLSLPGRDGLEILKDLQRKSIESKVLILTARESLEDRVLGLDSGADDYLGKPFAYAELSARIRALLRRDVGRGSQLRCGDLEVDLIQRKVTLDGTEIPLSGREFDLIVYLLRHKNTNVTREMLARDVWNEPSGVQTNAIEVCINGLRRKIDFEKKSRIIVTVRGVGYSIRENQ